MAIIKKSFNEYAEKVCSQLREQLIRAEVDDRSESLNKKVREAQLAQINYILVLNLTHREEVGLTAFDKEG